MSRNWKGQKPIGDQWTEIDVINAYGIKWGISMQPYLPTGWATFKVYAIGKAPNKANYWGTWNGQRTSRGRELGVMADNRPVLLVLVEKALLINGFKKEK